MLAGNVSSLEAIWSGVAIIGIAVAVGFLANVWLSYRAVQSWIERGWARRWGPRYKFVVGFLSVAGLLVLVWIGFAVLGINAMLSPPPLTPDRAAASERGGLILVVLEVFLLGLTGLLLWAWVAVGRPSMPNSAADEPSLADLLEASTEAGRTMGHLIADDLQMPVGAFDLIASDPRVPADVRRMAAEANESLDRIMERVRRLHAEIKRLGGAH